MVCARAQSVSTSSCDSGAQRPCTLPLARRLSCADLTAGQLLCTGVSPTATCGIRVFTTTGSDTCLSIRTAFGSNGIPIPFSLFGALNNGTSVKVSRSGSGIATACIALCAVTHEAVTSVARRALSSLLSAKMQTLQHCCVFVTGVRSLVWDACRAACSGNIRHELWCLPGHVQVKSRMRDMCRGCPCRVLYRTLASNFCGELMQGCSERRNCLIKP